MQAASWSIGVDVGGTFTDFYAFERHSGAVALHKTSSTPANPAEAILTGLDELAAKTGFQIASVGALAHGTTVATNALIQRRGARVAMVTTENFRDLVEIGRQIRPKLYDLKADHPMPLAPRDMRFGVRERIGADGKVVVPLDRDSADAVIEALKACGADAVAVTFLFSYLNPSHEQAMKALIAEALPDIAISVSSDVQPEFREYERSSTTLLNAYLQPSFSRYMSTLKESLERSSPEARVGINQSNGGLMSVDKARDFPIRTAMSGPAAGTMGAIHTARLSGRADIITFDMGGTSADVALIRNLESKLAFDRDVAGFPVRMPMIDINTVGAGGGSIGWFDRDGLVKVGPVSAGAVPGPACYGRGGTEPTVTDANAVLGRLSGHGLLGGSMSLDVEASRQAVGKIADRLGFTLERAAIGMLDIVSANMVRAIRAISVERGHDPRDFVLMPFGGAGPLHAEGCAQALGIAEIVIPYSPGILCAQGLLVADRSESFVRSQRLALTEANAAALSGLVASMMEEAEAWWKAEAVEQPARGRKLAVDMRYASQNYELQVPFDDLPSIEEMRQLFFQAHEQAYGFHSETDPVDVVAVRLTALGRLPSPAIPPVPADATSAPEPRDIRPVWFDAVAAVETPVYDRATFAPGTVLQGPAVIDQFDATCLLFPGDVAIVDDAMNIVITRKGSAR
jgi:N-methylhydantoinase A